MSNWILLWRIIEIRLIEMRGSHPKCKNKNKMVKGNWEAAFISLCFTLGYSVISYLKFLPPVLLCNILIVFQQSLLGVRGLENYRERRQEVLSCAWEKILTFFDLGSGKKYKATSFLWSFKFLPQYLAPSVLLIKKIKLILHRIFLSCWKCDTLELQSPQWLTFL